VNDQDAAMKARKFIAEVGTPALPVLVDAYAGQIGGTVTRETLGEQEDAWSVQLPNGKYRICVNCAHNSRRQRFSVCHEVAHVVLEIPADHSAPSWSYARRSPGEIACDVFAAELLLPYKLFKPRVDAADMGLAAISEFVLSEEGKVRYCARSTSLRSAGAWVKPGSLIPSDTLSDRARRGDVTRGAEEVEPDQWFEDWERDGSLYEDVRYLNQWDQTLTLLWFDDDELPPATAQRPRWEEESQGLRELDGILPWPGKSRRKR
jgi:hypothetical protein